MSTPLKLSFSKISSFSLCGERYKKHYILKLRPKFTRASLLFGSSIDEALNTLLETKDLEKATRVFDKKWNFQYINKKLSPLKENPDILYSSSDFDKNLLDLSEEDLKKYIQISEDKKNKGWINLDIEDRKFYNKLNWMSLHKKGLIILRDYNKKILPQFIEIKGVQHKTELVNNDGDSITQVLDFVALMKDGSVVLFDNKTTSNLSYYPDDAPGTSPQLISYYFNTKEQFGLTSVGFVAIQKTLLMNKTKVCSKCNFDGSGGRHKTCNNETDGGRCGGEWIEKVDPECAIKMIINDVSDSAIDLVLSTFDEANRSIKSGNFYRNLAACKNIYGSECEFIKLCWKGDDSDLISEEEASKME